MTSNKQWNRNWLVAFLLYFRDNVFFRFPLKKVPSFLVRFFYGGKFDFIFLIHPRRSQDYFIAVPALSVFRRSRNKKHFLKIIRALSPCVVSKIVTKDGLRGLVISTPMMPADLMKYRKVAKKEAERIIIFAGKLLKGRRVIGLGAWWPIVTARGKVLLEVARDNGCTITTGHTLTVLSIVLSVERISNISKVPINKLKIAIVGGGKIGEQLGRALLSRSFRDLTIIDINQNSLKTLRHKLKKEFPTARIDTYLNEGSLHDVFNRHHLGICATSSIRRFIGEEDIPRNFIILDDSRPEAVSRNLIDKSKVVLEGGGMKFKGVKSGYDYGMGFDENIFGCLGETILLSMDKTLELKPTLEGLSIENLRKFFLFCERNDIAPGDFKIGSRAVSDETVIKLMKERDGFLST